MSCWCVVVMVVEDAVLVLPESRSFLPHTFVLMLKDTFIVLLVDCLVPSSKFMIHYIRRIKKQQPTLSSHLINFVSLFSVVANFDNSAVIVPLFVVTLFNKYGSVSVQFISSRDL